VDWVSFVVLIKIREAERGVGGGGGKLVFAAIQVFQNI